MDAAPSSDAQDVTVAPAAAAEPEPAQEEPEPARASKKRKHASVVDTPPAGLETVGCFMYTPPMDAASLALLQELHSWWSVEDRLKHVLLRVIEPSVDGHIALRPLTWLVTNYVRNKGISFVREGSVFNVEEQHAAQLDKYKRRNFDTFRRGPRIYFYVDGKFENTTVAQLNFIRWAHMNGVLDYTHNNREEIMADQEAAMKETASRKASEKKNGSKPKRAQLSKSVDAPCVVIDMYTYALNVEVVFDPETNSK